MRRLNLEISNEAYENLEWLRKELNKASKAEVLRSAVALLDIATREKEKGNKLGVIDKSGKVDARIELV